MLALIACLVLASCGSEPPSLASTRTAAQSSCAFLTESTEERGTCEFSGYAFFGRDFNNPDRPACASGPQYRVAIISDGEVVAALLAGVNARYIRTETSLTTTLYPFRFFFAATVTGDTTAEIFGWSPAPDEPLHPIAGLIRLKATGTGAITDVHLENEPADLAIPTTCGGGGALRWIDANVDGGGSEPDLVEFLESVRASM